jgi:hypothetical protein
MDHTAGTVMSRAVPTTLGNTGGQMGILVICLVALAVGAIVVVALRHSVRTEVGDSGVPHVDVFCAPDAGSYDSCDGGYDAGCDGGGGGGD